MNSTALSSFQFGMNRQGFAAARLHTKTAGNLKIALSENIALLLNPHVDVPCNLVVT